MGAIECCRLNNKEREIELMSEKNNHRLFNQSIEDPQELDKQFEDQIEAFPFALSQIIVYLYTNSVYRKNAVFLVLFSLISVRVLPNTTWL